MKKVLTLICLLVLSSAANAANDDKVYLSVEIIQTLSKTSALARTSNWDVVKIQTSKDVYYDGKKISDYFVFIDTYSYETNSGIVKTVPVYVRQSELDKSGGESSNSSSRKVEQLSVEVIQTLQKGIALARTSDFDIVRIDSKYETFYDGKKISGRYILVDTYSYETNRGTVKTVPVYVAESEINGTAKPKEKNQAITLSVEIIQTLSKNEALARTSDWDVVKLETTEDVYYDGKKISGRFVMVGTYTYTTRNDMDKTVPVYLKESEYKKVFEE